MSQEAAVAFLERVETDEQFANELESLTEDPDAVVEKIRAEGFDVQPEEVRQAFLDRYGAELTPEQMEQIAAGADSQEQAVAFLERLEDDEDFARELASIREDPNAVGERVHAAGFEASPEEIREAFVERYGSELTPEQLDQIAAGADAGLIAAEVGVPYWWLM